MARKRKAPEPEQVAGAPEWMVTFSDCMTLLLTFFVLLLSFSSFDDDEVFKQIKVVFSKEDSLQPPKSVDGESFLATDLIQSLDDLDEGSEKPTLARGSEDNLKKETKSVNFRDRKVFFSSSDKFFYGNGSILSSQGRDTLDQMAFFLQTSSSRIVISENPPTDSNLGLERAWAVQNYLITKHSLDKNNFNIAAETLQQNFGTNDNIGSGAKSNRMLEIVLLERSIYD